MSLAELWLSAVPCRTGSAASPPASRLVGAPTLFLGWCAAYSIHNPQNLPFASTLNSATGRDCNSEILMEKQRGGTKQTLTWITLKQNCFPGLFSCRRLRCCWWSGGESRLPLQLTQVVPCYIFALQTFMGEPERNTLFSSLQYPSFKYTVTQIKQYFYLGKDTKLGHFGLQQEGWVSLASFSLLSVILGSQDWHYFRRFSNKFSGCSGPWIPPPNTSPSAPQSLWEGFASWHFCLNARSPKRKTCWSFVVVLVSEISLVAISTSKLWPCSWKKNNSYYNHSVLSCPKDWAMSRLSSGQCPPERAAGV